MGVATVIDGASAEVLCGQPKLGSLGSAYSGDGGIGGTVSKTAGVSAGEVGVVVVGIIGVGYALSSKAVVVEKWWFISCGVIQNLCAASCKSLQSRTKLWSDSESSLADICWILVKSEQRMQQ